HHSAVVDAAHLGAFGAGMVQALEGDVVIEVAMALAIRGGEVSNYVTKVIDANGPGIQGSRRHNVHELDGPAWIGDYELKAANFVGWQIQVRADNVAPAVDPVTLRVGSCWMIEQLNGASRNNQAVSNALAVQGPADHGPRGVHGQQSG